MSGYGWNPVEIFSRPIEKGYPHHIGYYLDGITQGLEGTGFYTSPESWGDALKMAETLILADQVLTEEV